MKAFDVKTQEVLYIWLTTENLQKYLLDIIYVL